MATPTTDYPMPPALIKAPFKVRERFCIMTMDGGMTDEEALLGYFRNTGRQTRDLEI
jgi:hypothetical protein